MTIGVAQEGPYLVAPIHRRREELGSARAPYLVSSKAVRYANVQYAADGVRVRGRRKGHRGFILSGTASDRQQQFAAPKAQEAEYVGNLANHLRSQHVAIEGQGAGVIARHKKVSQFYTAC